jgi:hypothetical protein
MTDEECAAELAKYEIDVVYNMTQEIQGYAEWVTSHRWTLLGLRHALAREKFIESVTCNIEGVWEKAS